METGRAMYSPECDCPLLRAAALLRQSALECGCCRRLAGRRRASTRARRAPPAIGEKARGVSVDVHGGAGGVRACLGAGVVALSLPHVHEGRGGGCVMLRLLGRGRVGGGGGVRVAADVEPRRGFGAN
jgi:hypothetical protein